MVRLCIFFLVLIAESLYGQETVFERQQYNLKKGVAVEGYDVVSYFTDTKPVKGFKTITTTYNGVVYHFISEAHKATFISNPEKYKPQYGGWCAYAMGNSGEKVSVDPETFKVSKGKLYLFYHSFFSNTLTLWNKDEKALLLKANHNWEYFLKKNQ